jgi:hypothetical protein
MYSNRVYIVEVDASLFVDVFRIQKVDRCFFLKTMLLYIPALAVSIYVERQAISGFVD